MILWIVVWFCSPPLFRHLLAYLTFLSLYSWCQPWNKRCKRKNSFPFFDLPSQLFLFLMLEYYEQRIVFKAHTAFEMIEISYTFEICEISFHISFHICWILKSVKSDICFKSRRLRFKSARLCFKSTWLCFVPTWHVSFNFQYISQCFKSTWLQF